MQTNQLYVGGLPYSVTDTQLQVLQQQFEVTHRDDVIQVESRRITAQSQMPKGGKQEFVVDQNGKALDDVVYPSRVTQRKDFISVFNGQVPLREDSQKR